MFAIVKNNKVICPKCESELDNNKNVDYCLSEVEGEKFFQFKRECSSCKKVVKYYIDTSFDKRYSFKNKNIKEIKGSD